MPRRKPLDLRISERLFDTLGINSIVAEVILRIVREESDKEGTGVFFIRKSSRTSVEPYDGPTLRGLGMKSRWYSDRAEAQRDADRLSSANPVGFEVIDVRDEIKKLHPMYRKFHTR